MADAHNAKQLGDTTYTKIFVGGLAWQTNTDIMKQYFDQFGEIIEAVVITDKHTGRSKGYGFVTFKDPNSARRACQNPYPVIDGRRANCNLAVMGAQRNRPSTPQQGTNQKFSTTSGNVATYTVFNQLLPQYFIPSPAYRYPGYYEPQVYTNTMNYYNPYGAQYVPSRYMVAAWPQGAMLITDAKGTHHSTMSVKPTGAAPSSPARLAKAAGAEADNAVCEEKPPAA